jgi:hypothetical protein
MVSCSVFDYLKKWMLSQPSCKLTKIYGEKRKKAEKKQTTASS